MANDSYSSAVLGDGSSGYDHNINMYSPDGRVFQLEYARAAANRGTPALALQCNDGVVVVGEKRLFSKLVLKDSVKKIFKIDDGVVIAASGIATDYVRLIDVARQIAAGYAQNYGETISPQTLAQKLGAFMGEITHHSNVRPYGAAFLICGFDSIIQMDAGGSYVEVVAGAIGAGAKENVERLEQTFKEMTCEEGTKYLCDFFDEEAYVDVVVIGV